MEWFPKFLDGTFAVVEDIGPFVVGTGQFLFDVFVGALDLDFMVLMMAYVKRLVTYLVGKS